MRLRLFKILTMVLFIVVFSSLAYSQITLNDLNKVEQYYFNQEMHGMLEETVGSDIPVETITQAIDQFAHGEFDKAKNTLSEEAAKQIAGILLGSTGGSLVGYAWDFAKYSLQSVQSWGKNVERRLFIKDFLNPEIERWKASKKVTDIRTLRSMFNQWFDDNEMRLGRTEFFKDRKKWIEQLKFEMWSKTLEVNTKYRKYFLILKRLQTAAKQKEEEIKYLKWKAKYLAKQSQKKLKCAHEPVTVNTVKRFMTDRNYKLAVLKTCAINKATNSDLNVNNFKTLISSLKGLTYNKLIQISKILSSAGYETDFNHVRLFILDSDFRKVVIKKYKTNKQNKETQKTLPLSPKEFKKVKEKIADVPVFLIVEIINEKNTKSSKKKITEIAKRDLKNIKKQIKSGRRKVNINLNPYISYLSELKEKFIHKKINYDQFLSGNKFIFDLMKNNIFPYIERNKAQVFIRKAQALYKEAENVRNHALNDLRNLNLQICAKDNLLNKIKRAKNEVDAFILRNRCQYASYKINKLFTLSNHNMLSGSEFDNTYNESLVCLEKISTIIDYIEKKEEKLNNLFADFLRNFSILNDAFDEKITEYATYEVFNPYNMTCINYYKRHISQATRILNNMEDLQNQYLKTYETVMNDSDFLAQQLDYYKSLSILVFEASKIKRESFNLTAVPEFVKTMKRINYLLLRAIPSDLDNGRGTDESEINWVRLQTNRFPGYKSLSYYKNLKRVAIQQLREGCKKLDAFENNIASLFDKMSRIASRLRLWPSDLKLAYEKLKVNYDKYTSSLDEQNKYCSNSFKSDFEQANNILKKCEFLEIKIKNRLDECLKKYDQWRCPRYINFAKALPFKPSFDVSRYEAEINRIAKKDRYFAPPKITRIIVNGRIVHKWVAAAYPQAVRVKAFLSNSCNSKKCKPKSAVLDCGIIKTACSVQSNKAICALKPSHSFQAYCKLMVKNYAGEKEEKGFTLDYENFLAKASQFMDKFAQYYSNNKSLKNFLFGSDLSSEWIKICDNNRSNGINRLSFGKPKLVAFNSFEKDINFNRYSITFSIPWNMSGKVNKSGTAVVTVVNRFRPSMDRTYSFISKVEGDSFFVNFARNDTHFSKSGKVRSGLLTHTLKPKMGGYSIDFETGKYKRSEEDIACGYVNPKDPNANRPYFGVGQVVDMGRISLNSVKSCPKIGYTDYYSMTKVKIGHTYCIKTKEGHYAKVYILNAGGTGLNAYIKFNWVYSPNGRF